jgi:hypothetical protein
MVRGSSSLCALALIGLSSTGCSLLLDFSDKAIPKDATPDGPFPQTECMFDEPNDTPDAAMVLAAGLTLGPAAICPAAMGQPDDQDYYRFTVPDNTTSVTVQINFTNRPTGDLDLKLFAADGVTQLGQSRGFGDSETITCPGASPSCAALAPADYVFLVFPAVPGATNDYTMNLTITPGA